LLLLNVVRLIVSLKFSFDTQLESLSLLAVVNSGGKQFDEVVLSIFYFLNLHLLYFFLATNLLLLLSTGSAAKEESCGP
jgi:hypothetical protein